MKLPYPLFRHIMSFRDMHYETARSAGTPSSLAIRNLIVDGPTVEHLGSLAKIHHHVTIVCWIVSDDDAIFFCLRRVHSE